MELTEILVLRLGERRKDMVDAQVLVEGERRGKGRNREKEGEGTGFVWG